MICPLGKSTDEMLAYGERILTKNGLVHKGETTLVTAAAPQAQGVQHAQGPRRRLRHLPLTRAVGGV